MERPERLLDLRRLTSASRAASASVTAGACDSRQAFLNQVAAQAAKKKLTADQADELTDAANEIRELLDC